MLKPVIAACLTVGLLVGSTTQLRAQREVEPRTPVDGLALGGRVHTQFGTTSIEGEPSTTFSIRRARIYVAAAINDWIDGVAQLDFSAGNAAGRYMFVRGTLNPAFRVTAGQFKRAFDMFELTSSSQILVIERAGRIRGVDACAGVGGICSYSRLSEQLELSSLDVGVMADGTFADGRAEYRLSLTNGTGDNRSDDNSSKSLSGRVQYNLGREVNVGANLASHDYTPPEATQSRRAGAWAVDLEWGDFAGGPHVQVGVMGGDNWAHQTLEGGEAPFLTWQSILAYRAVVSDRGRIRAVEPVARVSWADSNRDVASGSGWLVTPGVAAHFEGRNKLAANVDVWSPTNGSRAWALLMQAYLYF